ncbi:WYL domain-containing protein [Streptomyces griseoluteus]|uniref:WYL domain-containing protein n=1 Tax=Streptomyces griseoluteus TaxID=29306 RepID=A0A4Z1DE28_STRGP|nr:WYL domain-containing protein [Streptomyces griseoluteus]
MPGRARPVSLACATSRRRHVSRAEPGPDGHRHASVHVGSLTHAAAELLRPGPDVEVLAPAGLRERLAAPALYA